MSPDEGPRDVHARLLRDRREVAARLERRDRRISDARLVVFLIAVVLGVLSLGMGGVGWPGVAPPVAVFVGLVVVHDVVDRRWRRARRAAAFHERGLARVEGRWAGTGEPGTRYLEETHP